MTQLLQGGCVSQRTASSCSQVWSSCGGVSLTHKPTSCAVAVWGLCQVVVSLWQLLLANWELFLQGRFGIKKLVPCSGGWVRLGEACGSGAQSRSSFRVGACSPGGVTWPGWAVKHHTAAPSIPLYSCCRRGWRSRSKKMWRCVLRSGRIE